MRTMLICDNGVEECEALLTYDMLYRAEVDIDIVGIHEELTSSHDVVFKPQLLLKDINPNDYECLIIPGGSIGTVNLKNNKDVSDLIDLFVKENKLICAICAGPSILLEKGLLKDNEFTCAPGCESGYISTKEKAHKYNYFITGIGLGGTFEFASMIIEEMKGKEVLDKVLKKINY